VWQLVGVEKIQNGSRCHRNQDHFCVFQFFNILVASMATTAILKKSNLISTTSRTKIMGWCDVRYCFAMAILVIIIILIILPHIFVRSISRRCLDQTL
jgi:hypothetical protein